MRKADRADAALLSSPFLSSVDERLALAGSLSHLLLALAEAGFARDHRAFESFRRHHWKVLTDGRRLNQYQISTISESSVPDQ